MPGIVRMAHLSPMRMKGVELGPGKLEERVQRLRMMNGMSRDDLRLDADFCRLRDHLGCCSHKPCPFVSRDGRARV